MKGIWVTPIFVNIFMGAGKVVSVLDLKMPACIMMSKALRDAACQSACLCFSLRDQVEGCHNHRQKSSS